MNKFWFKPKRFGYGAQPTTWEGWAVIGLFGGFLISISKLAETNLDLYLAIVLVCTVALVYISKKKTDGEWKFSWK